MSQQSGARMAISALPLRQQVASVPPIASRALNVVGPLTSSHGAGPGAGGSAAVLQYLQRTAGNGAAALWLQRSQASDLIRIHTTTLGNLNEEQLGVALLGRALAGNVAFVRAVFEELGETDRDDVAFSFCEAAESAQLAQLASSAGGRALLDQMFDDLTSGSVGKEEQEQAGRILEAKSPGADAKKDQNSSAGGKVFPFRLPGVTVWDAAPIKAERRGDGFVWVHLPQAVQGTHMFAEEVRTLPLAVFVSGLTIPVDEMVGVKLYDLGGQVVRRPALFLLQLSGQATVSTLAKIAEVAGVGLTLGTGAVASAGAEATGAGAETAMGLGARALSAVGIRPAMAARAVAAADRGTFIAGTLSSALLEHRSELSAKSARWAAFVRYVEKAQSACEAYGFVRLATTMPGVLAGLGRSLRALRSRVASRGAALTAADRSLPALGADADEVLEHADAVRATKAVGGPEPSPPESSFSEPDGAAGQTKAAATEVRPSGNAPVGVPTTAPRLPEAESPAPRSSGGGAQSVEGPQWRSPADSANRGWTAPDRPVVPPGTKASGSSVLVSTFDEARASTSLPKPLPDYFDVWVHGKPTTFRVFHLGEWVSIDHRRLAAFIRRSGYKGGKIRLMSCLSGSIPNGIAQNLANKMGVEIMAPTDILWVKPDGSMMIGPRVKSPSGRFVASNTGKWEDFKPRNGPFDIQPSQPNAPVGASATAEPNAPGGAPTTSHANPPVGASSPSQANAPAGAPETSPRLPYAESPAPRSEEGFYPGPPSVEGPQWRSPADSNRKLDAPVRPVLPPGAKASGAAVLVSTFDHARAGTALPKQLPDYYDVWVHGQPTTFRVSHLGEWISIDHRRLASFIRRSGYKGGKIRLLSCLSGNIPDGVAQNLANKMGVEVMAPTDILWVEDDGSMMIGPKVKSPSGEWGSSNTGKWEDFKPRKVR
ncbi:MAG: hypothetical protein M3N98_14410 [Actinomycetota bacterium]|nr:hypothetical protein [Actinomycetota bacterium]